MHHTRDALLDISDLTVRFGSGAHAVRAVDGVSLAIRRGETFALVGESGCGKSATALSILQLLPWPAAHIERGVVLFDGTDLLSLPEVELRRIRGRRIGMIFQEPMTALNAVLTVGTQIGEVLTRHLNLKGLACRRRALDLLEAVGIPDPARRHDEYPHQLSGGMKQRVMIALAIAAEPDLLIADEPTTALDVTLQAQVLELLRALARTRGMALLLITHDLGVVAEMADRVAVMYAGEIVEHAPCADFFSAPHHPYSQKLFDALPGTGKRAAQLAVIPGTVPARWESMTGCRFAPRCAYAFDSCRALKAPWRRLEDRAWRCHLAAPPLRQSATQETVGTTTSEATQPRHPLLEVHGLTVHFPIRRGLLRRRVGAVQAVNGIDLTLARGRTLALVGESGCGKTTVGKAILQLIKPTAGTVTFDGTRLDTLTPSALRPRRAAFQIVFQDPYASLDPRMMVGMILEEGKTALGIGASLHERRARIAQLMEHVGLAPEMAARYPHEFSGGQRQRIAIARALAVDPRLLVCDEPTSALDISVQAQILNLLRGLQQELGLAYLFMTHNLAVVGYLAHDVAVMYLGRIVEQGPVQRVLEQPAHPYTRALLAAAPVPDPAARRKVLRLPGEPPSSVTLPAGCPFHTRCPEVMPRCRDAMPPPSILHTGHEVRCYLHTP